MTDNTKAVDNKIIVIEQKLINQARSEEAEGIRKILSANHHNALITYKRTKEDHRFHQGYLLALEAIYNQITNL